MKHDGVEVEEAFSIIMGNFLLSNGYLPDVYYNFKPLKSSCPLDIVKDIYGEIGKEREEITILGFLCFLFSPFSSRPCRPHIGVISLYGSSNKFDWEIRAYGRKYLSEVKVLAEKLQKEFEVRIRVCLVSEECSWDNPPVEV